MLWQKIVDAPPPVGRPILVRTVETDQRMVAFLGPDGIWYEGGALVQTSSTVLGATPTEWCEPKAEDSF